MKKTFALFMSIAILATATVTSFAATIKYPVAGISSQGYVEDEDGDLYLNKPVNKVSYGETVYFPLLSASSREVDAAFTAWKNAEANYKTAKEAYDTAVKEAKTVGDAYTALNAAKTAYTTAHAADPNAAVTDTKTAAKVAEELETTKRNFATAEEKYIEARNTLEAKAWETTPGLDSGQKAQAKENAERNKTAKENELNTARTARGNAEKANTLKLKETAYIDEAQKTTVSTSTVAQADGVLTSLEGKKKTANDKVTSTEKTMGEKDTLQKNAKEAYEKAVKAKEYAYVYEPDAIKNVKITKKWEENGNYAPDVSVTRHRVSSHIDGSTTSSMNYIYFLKIKIKSSTSTVDRDLLGTITLKKSGSDGFTVSTSVGIELGYESASTNDNEGLILRKPTTFKEDKGFDAEDGYRFEFDEDSKSSFVVNTVGQGSIILSFNRDYDEKIGKKYPDANLEFYNGNYASFNRVGDLYLSYKDDDAYVYSISSSGELSRIEANWDDYEDAYKIRTRTLGRYIISDKRLTISNSSTGSSSSGSGSGGTGSSGSGGTTIVTPITPSSSSSYPYTPPVVSSSTPPPASSSSSEASSEEEPEEPEEEPEDEDDEDDIVSVIVDEEDSEGPEKKGGISGWVWALIITGLTAIPVAIGVFYYINNRPIRRDFFDSDDNDDYDDDDFDAGNDD